MGTLVRRTFDRTSKLKGEKEMGDAKRMQKQKKSGAKILIIILILLIIAAGSLLAMKMMQNKESEEQIDAANTNKNEIQEPKQEEKKEPKTFAGNERPIAFMIDNNINAMPQAGLEQADLIYEIIVEGGETRLMMVMKNQNLKKIGPIRSSRHYFIDYAMENDAIYIHYGHSPQAGTDFTKFGIDHIEGVYDNGSNFWRDTTRYAPHNAVISTANLEKVLKNEGFRRTTTKENVLNYTAEEVVLEDKKEVVKANDTNTTSEPTERITNLANSVTIPYSQYNTVKYTYNKDTKTYTRYSRDTVQKDWNTNKAIQVKNIIITKCENSTIDSYGRQTINNVKTLDGYYITNGKYIPIKCEKTSRIGQTKYKDLQGNEIEVNDGKTFIQICPINSKISFK